VHEACPEVKEDMKWSMPHFTYKGMFCGMASFKEHVTFGFWKGALVVDGNGRNAEAMGQFGRITKVSDLPPKKVLMEYIKAAKKLNDDGVKSPTRSKPKPKKELPVPQDLSAALKRNKKAMATFDGFTPSHRREYVEWITQAKGEDTRKRRLDTAIEWMSEGKPRNWKYMKS
jgi:uncharacterized protein YdeI (YjbR/CyaY-like superfamily)